MYGRITPRDILIVDHDPVRPTSSQPVESPIRSSGSDDALRQP
jgi:hypothetical protein